MSIDKIGHVTTQLSMLANRLSPKRTATGYKIRCPYHAGGHERTPSCGVNLTTTEVPVGYFFCHACKEKGTWDKLAAMLNLEGFRAADQVHDVAPFSFMDSQAARDVAARLPPEDHNNLPFWPKDQVWRRITADVVRRFNGSLPANPDFTDDFLYFPVLVHDKAVGGVYARIKTSPTLKAQGMLSYINTSGSWTKEALFGYDVAKKRAKQPLWIVEGPRDVMKTYQVGGRAVGLMGAYVGPRKLSLIEALDPPAIVIATDPDEAGDLARKKLKDGLSMFAIHEAVFPKNKDAGNFTEVSYAKMLKKLGLA